MNLTLNSLPKQFVKAADLKRQRKRIDEQASDAPSLESISSPVLKH
jgi:hypothetical protein